MKKWFSRGVGAMCMMVILFACGKGGTEIDDDGSSGGPHSYVPTDVTAPGLTTPVW